MSVAGYARANAKEIDAVVDALDDDTLEALVERILNASRVYFTGVGRSGLTARAIAMRLMHIGLSSFVVGETSTPGIREGDLLVAVTATGRGSVAAQGSAAKDLGAGVAAITARPQGDLQDLASPVVILPIRTSVATEQHAGSLFEQAALVIGDAICRVIQERLDVPTAELDRRHANLS